MPDLRSSGIFPPQFNPCISDSTRCLFALLQTCRTRREPTTLRAALGRSVRTRSYRTWPDATPPPPAASANEDTSSTADSATVTHLQSRTASLIHTHTHTHTFNGPLSGTTRVSLYQKGTRSYASAEVPRDAPCHSKPCQLLHGCGTSRTNRSKKCSERGTVDRRLIDSHVDRRMFCQQDGPSTSFVDNTMDLL